MNRELELLMQLQDLDLMLRELGTEPAAAAEKKLGFSLTGGAETIKKARAQLANQLSSDCLKMYERIATRYPRAIVPMRDGVCFGCFVRQPTKKAAELEPEDQMEHCQRCGRILFRFRFP